MITMKTLLITSGGTRERIDNVRVIANIGRGTLGSQIAAEALQSGQFSKIIYVYGPGAVMPPESPSIVTIPVEGVNDLARTMQECLTREKVDAVIHSMAVSDYYVESVQAGDTTQDQDGKISSDHEHVQINLVRAPKVIRSIKKHSPQTMLVGFKLLDGAEDRELISRAQQSCEQNGCDLVVANDLAQIRSGAPHRALFVERSGIVSTVDGKDMIAKELIRRVSHG
jgi:phosphopantothenate-cysteine ligase